MKMMKSIILCALLFSTTVVMSQNFSVLSGNNERNGLSKLTGSKSVNTPLWTINNATHTNLACNVYSYGDLFVNSRRNNNSAVIECRNLQTGELVWTSPFISDNSMLYTTAFNEDAVYAHDYHSGQYFAFNKDNGEIKWVYEDGSYTFGPADSPIFTCEGHLVINSSLDIFLETAELLVCLHKETGQVLWINKNFVPYLPNKVKAAHGNKLYMITGAAIGMPKKIGAVDLNTGNNLYYSDPLPGSSGQNHTPFIGNDGTIYFFRDPVANDDEGATLFSFTDNGNGFILNWTYRASSTSSFSSTAIDKDGNILINNNARIQRINKQTGLPTDSTTYENFIVNANILASNDGVVYVSDKEGNNYAFSHDLQTTIWKKTITKNYYSAPNLSKDGIMIFAGIGNTIQAYKTTELLAPVADFYVSSRVIHAGQTINIFDQSSFNPTNWQWSFPGAEIETSSEKNPQNIKYNEPGVYQITLIASNSLGNDTLIKQCYIHVKEPTYIAVEQIPNINIFPNPASEYMHIDGFLNNSPIVVSIFCITGKLVYQNQHYLAESNRLTVKLTDISKGLYIVNIQQENLFIQKKLVIID